MYPMGLETMASYKLYICSNEKVAYIHFSYCANNELYLNEQISKCVWHHMRPDGKRRQQTKMDYIIE